MFLKGEVGRKFMERLYFIMKGLYFIIVENEEIIGYVGLIVLGMMLESKYCIFRNVVKKFLEMWQKNF